MIDQLKSQNFYLSVENGQGETYEAYPFWGDNRFTGTWCTNFQKEKDQITFVDFKTGLNFKGKLLPKNIQLGIYLGKYSIAEIELSKSTAEWEFGGFHAEKDDLTTEFTALEDSIAQGVLSNVHAVLISKKGKLVYERYFDGYNSHIPHDMRSASKSISSAIAGIANDQSLYKSVKQSIFDFLPEQYQSFKDSATRKIDLESLLTMSSGLDADDYTRTRKSLAAEHNYQPTADWTTTVLQAPMINAPNTEANYGSANPFLLGVAMTEIVDEPLEFFMDEYLFKKLNISNYIIQTDITSAPYFGGGIYLRPKDMLKFGELYLNKGKWKSKRILSKKWVASSFKKYRPLANVPDKNEYGYLWWHNTYQVAGKSIQTIEARGAGGQYIFVIPALEIVAVITSGNYRNGKTQQPEMILEKMLLPTLLK